jgi:hypothetical protein
MLSPRYVIGLIEIDFGHELSDAAAPIAAHR